MTPPTFRSFAVALGFCVLGACGGSEPAEYRIGVMALADSAWEATSGEPTLRAADLAVKEINARGPIELDGRPYQFRVVRKGHAPRADDATTKARALLNRDSVHAIIGPQSSLNAIPVGSLAEVARVPMISPMSSNPRTTDERKFVFRLAFLDEVQGEVLADYAIDDLEARTAAVLFDESLAYSGGLAAVFEETFESRGGRVVAVETYTADAADTFMDQLTRIAAADPDVLFLPNLTQPDSIQMVEARRLGIDASFLGSDSWDLQRLSKVPEAEGAIATHQWHWETPDTAVASFLERFDAEYSRIPRTTAAMTYDAFGILAEALRRAGTTDPEIVANTIRDIRGYRGVTGSITFAGSQDPARSVVLSTVRNREIVLVRRDDRGPGAP